MTRVNKICLSVLMLGAAAIAVPAMAQDAQNNANPTENAQASADAAQPATNAAADASTSPSATSTNTQTAMNTSSGDAAANANVSSVGDTSKKYHRATRAKDFRAEAKITQQLNQQASIAAKPTQTAMN